MIDELNTAISEYQDKWRQLIAGRKNKAFFETLKPTSVCFKVEDLAELDTRIAALRDQADHLHMGWINERWLVTIHLRDRQLEQGIGIVKLYQRRSGSSDATGLDHLDFYAPDIDEDMLADEPGLKWTHETNGEHCSWISLWFAETEAKLRADTTLEVCAKELQEINQQILAKIQ
jgi:hypothetical protein